MCGIAGVIKNSDQHQNERIVQTMLDQIIHRGPDSYGLWANHKLAFGMRRLSIIDLEKGDQPIWSESGIGIVFNGEIYNFKTLKSNLIQKGYVFKTESDTEVILALYIQNGIQFIETLQGMFAIFLYDPRIQKIYLIRDRLGKKPLYYYHDDDTFFFSSEIKSILACIENKPSLNTQALWDYCTLRYVPGPETIWEKIYKLDPGHYLEYDLTKKKFELHAYWTAQFRSAAKDKQNYCKQFEDLFLQAVEKRLLASDVPVGILLSGGLDSSCVAAAAVELGHKNFHTFSIGFKGETESNELPYARQVAQYIGSVHHEIEIDQQDFIQAIPEMVWYTDEPLADLAAIPLYFVSKLAREQVKVVLSGEGSDEILAGYNLEKLAQKLAILKGIQMLPRWVQKLFPYPLVKRLREGGYENILKSQGMHITNLFSEQEKRELCLFSPKQSTQDKIKAWYKKSDSAEPIDQLQQVYCHSWLVEDLLMKADKMSMATSLEIRCPFLDHHLVEWAATLPLSWKLGNFYTGFKTKRILREFAQKRLPKNIINRKKQGFPVPANQWLKGTLETWARNKLQSEESQRYFNPTKIESLFNEMKGNDNLVLDKIWNLLIFNEWANRWKV